ncbi:MAG: DUF6364 family protein [Spirochaetales bacterium]|nr:DUF6364 family protein [Spirochaetales bacterium]
MRNVTLAIDERLLTEARSYARKHGTTLNAMIRELLSKTVRSEADQSGAAVIQLFDELAGNSGGWKWNREELYDDRTSRHG